MTVETFFRTDAGELLNVRHICKISQVKLRPPRGLDYEFTFWNEEGRILGTSRAAMFDWIERKHVGYVVMPNTSPAVALVINRWDESKCPYQIGDVSYRLEPILGWRVNVNTAEPKHYRDDAEPIFNRGIETGTLRYVLPNTDPNSGLREMTRHLEQELKRRQRHFFDRAKGSEDFELFDVEATEAVADEPEASPDAGAGISSK